MHWNIFFEPWPIGSLSTIITLDNPNYNLPRRTDAELYSWFLTTKISCVVLEVESYRRIRCWQSQTKESTTPLLPACKDPNASATLLHLATDTLLFSFIILFISHFPPGEDLQYYSLFFPFPLPTYFLLSFYTLFLISSSTLLLLTSYSLYYLLTLFLYSLPSLFHYTVSTLFLYNGPTLFLYSLYAVLIVFLYSVPTLLL